MNFHASPIYSKYDKILRNNRTLIFWSVLVLFLIPICMAKIFSVDTWWHMQLGRSILEKMGWPDFSSFYYTPVKQVVHDLRFTWFGDILLYLIHLVSGNFGLQLFRLSIVGGTFVLLMSISGWRYSWVNLITLMMVSVGIYQKLLLRNSIFAIIFTTLIFWIWRQVRYENREKIIWFLPVLLGVWGCIHGSYLLGFGLVCLLFLGDFIDSMRGLNPGKKRMTIQFVIVILISFTAIGIKNPTTKNYYNYKIIKSLFSEKTAVEKPKLKLSEDMKKRGEIEGRYNEAAAVSIQKDKQELTARNFFSDIKKKLNNTIFKMASTQAVSGDFVSPFDMLDQIYIWACFIFCSLGIFLFSFCIRPFRLSYFLPFFAILILGSGYTRLIGYIPIVTTAIFFMASNNKEINLHFSNEIGWIAPIFIMLALYVNVFTGYRITIGTKLHTVGIGAIPTFSSKLPDIILKKYPDIPIFTTLTTGGYFLFEWYPRKKVFIDAYFAPHKSEVFDDYMRLITIENANPDFLYDKYGIRGAVIETNTGEANINFFNSKNWYPTILDRGLIFYEYYPDSETDIPLTNIIFNYKDIRFLSHWYKKRIADFLFYIPKVLIEKGRLKDTVEYLSKNENLMKHMTKYADQSTMKSTANSLKVYLEEYGVINDVAVAYDIKYKDAVGKGDAAKIIEYGEKILERKPDRYLVDLKLVDVYLKKGDFLKSKKILDSLYRKCLDDKAVKERIWDVVKESYYNVYQREKDEKKYIEAYRTLLKANGMSEKSNAEDIYMTFVTLVDDANKTMGPEVPYTILMMMEKDIDFYRGRILNDLAWHIAKYYKELDLNLDIAELYAIESIRKMKKENDDWLDLSYDTLAEIYFQKKEYKKMYEYEKKAIDSAPQERKDNYKYRDVPIG